MPDLSLAAWVVLALGAVVIGLSKAALPGAGTVAVVLFASVLPAKESTGTILLLLIASALAVDGRGGSGHGGGLWRHRRLHDDGRQCRRPVMSMYFLAARFPVQAFLGTSAWFFAVVNVSKLPFWFGLGLITPQGAVTALLLVPVVLAAAFVGRAFARRVDQRLFDRIVIVLTVIGSLSLLIPR